MTRAERILWEKIPGDKWLSQNELRQIMMRDGGMGGPPDPVGSADTAIRWLLDGSWIIWRVSAKQTRGRRHPVTAPDYEYRRNPLEKIPHEIETRRAVEEINQQRQQATSDLDQLIDRRLNERLRERGLVGTAEGSS